MLLRHIADLLCHFLSGEFLYLSICIAHCNDQTFPGMIPEVVDNKVWFSIYFLKVPSMIFDPWEITPTLGKESKTCMLMLFLRRGLTCSEDAVNLLWHVSWMLLLSDDDECGSGVSCCDQTCSNVMGDYICGCHMGFALTHDKCHCMGRSCLLLITIFYHLIISFRALSSDIYVVELPDCESLNLVIEWKESLISNLYYIIYM